MKGGNLSFSQRISRRNLPAFVPQEQHGTETNEMLNLRVVTDDDYDVVCVNSTSHLSY
jgi:hypothetical protein